MIWARKTTKRYVAFFDIMGFKDIVERNSHKEVVEKLEKLKAALKALESKKIHARVIGKNKSQLTRSITFSDSIVIFSKGNTKNDITKIIVDAAYIQYIAFKNNIAIKGVLSYGEVTVDFDNSLFFGRPIIDAYLLHDQINMYTVLIDNKFEAQLNKLETEQRLNNFVVEEKVFLKSGKINHKVVLPSIVKNLNASIEDIKRYYEHVSGQPRIYIDNTLAFFEELIKKEEVSR